MSFQTAYAYPTPPPHMMGAQAMAMKTLNAALYIGDLDDQMDEGMLYQYFMKFGPIYSVRIMHDVYNTKKSRGFGYVTFYSPKDAEAARINANHEVILKKPIRVTWKRNFRELEKDANVYIRNISPNITIRELDSYFSKFGVIFSSKIALDDDGISLGYGYIQFEKKEHAEACLSHGETHVLKDSELKVMKFQPSKSRDKKDLRNNLFIKNLPEDITEEGLKKIFEKYGSVVSLCLKMDEKVKRFYCFCCFSNNQEAANCLGDLSDKDIFGSNEKLYVNYAEKKEVRLKKLRESFANLPNETNLFTKNLKKGITLQEFKEAFSEFGEITSIYIKDIVQTDPKFPNETNCGFICYSNSESAKKALAYGPRNPKVQVLYKNQMIYLTYHYRKEQYLIYKEMKRRTMAKYFSRPFVAPMFIPYPMPVPPPMFGGNPYMGAPPPSKMLPPQHPPQNENYYRKKPATGGKPPRKDYKARPQKRPDNRPPPQNNVAQAPAQQENPQKVEFFSIQVLNEKIEDFKNLSQDRQRSILGELLFPLVQTHVSHETLAPKVTGMLIDFTVFEVADILEFLNNANVLHERVNEAEELIKSTSH